MNSFGVSALIFLLVLCSIVLPVLFILLAVILLFASFLLYQIFQSSWQYSPLPFYFSCVILLSLLTVILATLSKCKLFCSGYAARSLLKYQYKFACISLCNLFPLSKNLLTPPFLLSYLWSYIFLRTRIHTFDVILFFPIRRCKNNYHVPFLHFQTCLKSFILP